MAAEDPNDPSEPFCYPEVVSGGVAVICYASALMVVAALLWWVL